MQRQSPANKSNTLRGVADYKCTTLSGGAGYYECTSDSAERNETLDDIAEASRDRPCFTASRDRPCFTAGRDRPCFTADRNDPVEANTGNAGTCEERLTGWVGGVYPLAFTAPVATSWNMDRYRNTAGDGWPLSLRAEAAHWSIFIETFNCFVARWITSTSSTSLSRRMVTTLSTKSQGLRLCRSSAESNGKVTPTTSLQAVTELNAKKKTLAIKGIQQQRLELVRKKSMSTCTILAEGADCMTTRLRKCNTLEGVADCL